MTQELTTEYLDELEKLAKAATPGPYEAQSIHEPEEAQFIVAANLGGVVGAAVPWRSEIDSNEWGRVKANSAFIVAACNALPTLISALRTARLEGRQPMSEAPRDGTSILLLHRTYGWIEAYFSPGCWVQGHEGDEYEGSVWVCGDGLCQIEVEEIEKAFDEPEALGWLPLPLKDRPNG